jgi:hypothetical protein
VIGVGSFYFIFIISFRRSYYWAIEYPLEACMEQKYICSVALRMGLVDRLNGTATINTIVNFPCRQIAEIVRNRANQG